MTNPTNPLNLTNPTNKQLLRKQIREQKRRMTSEEIQTRSLALRDLFLKTQAYQDAKCIYGYLSYNQEVRTSPILEAALADGKQVAVPKVFGDSMAFIYLNDLQRVSKGYAGIPEPIDDGPVAHDETALVLMPGLAFDRQGHRIGYGGGFYDRFLAAEPRHPKIALCYDFQLFDRLETDDFDIPVDLVLSV